MCRQPRHNRQKPVIAIVTRDMTLTVGEVRQTVQKHDGTDRFSVRLEHEGAIEVLDKMRRIDRTTVKIAVGRHTIARLELLGHLALDVVEDRRFGGEILRPVGSIELVGMQFMRHVGVPWFERESPLRVVDADRK